MNRGILFPLIAAFWRDRLTQGGRVLVLAGVVLASISMFSLYQPVHVLLLLLFYLGLGALIVNTLHRPRLQLRVQGPEKVVAGHTAVFRAVVSNHGPRSACDVGVYWPRLPRPLKPETPSPPVNLLAPGGNTVFNCRVACPQRGIYALPDLAATTAFPFGIARARRAKTPAAPLIVLPAFTPLNRLDLDVSPRYQPGGITLTSSIGESPEYLGNRPYRPGDSMRHLDFRAWARLGEPAVREYQEEFYCRLMLVVDTEVARRWGVARKEELEAVLSLTAALTDHLSRGEFVIDIVLTGASVYRLRTGRHTGQVDRVLEILAAVQPVTEDPFADTTADLMEDLPQLSSVVMVLSRWSDSRAALARIAEEAGCRVKTILVSDDAGAAANAAASDVPLLHVQPEDLRAGRVDAL